MCRCTTAFPSSQPVLPGRGLSQPTGMASKGGQGKGVEGVRGGKGGQPDAPVVARVRPSDGGIGMQVRAEVFAALQTDLDAIASSPAMKGSWPHRVLRW